MRRLLLPVSVVLLLTLATLTPATTTTHSKDTDNQHNADNHSSEHDHHGGIHLASFRWPEYEWHICVTLTMILGVLINIYYHQIPILNSLPESCFLIVLGVVMGALIYVGGSEEDSVFKLTSNLFFNVLLPPIILDAAFSLYSRDFLANSANIIVYAVLGTVANILIIGFSLYGLGQANLLGTFMDTSGDTQMLEPVQVDASFFLCNPLYSLFADWAVGNWASSFGHVHNIARFIC